MQVIYRVCVDHPREFERDKYIEAGVVKGALAPSVAGADRSVISEVAWQPLTHQLSHAIQVFPTRHVFCAVSVSDTAFDEYAVQGR
jgi:hypothetical protein